MSTSTWYQYGPNKDDGYWVNVSVPQPQIHNTPTSYAYPGGHNSYANRPQQNAAHAQNMITPHRGFQSPIVSYQGLVQQPESKIDQEEAQRRLDVTRGLGSSHSNPTQDLSQSTRDPITPQQLSFSQAVPSNNAEIAPSKIAPKPVDLMRLISEGAFRRQSKYAEDRVQPKYQPLRRSDAFPQPAIVPPARAPFSIVGGAFSGGSENTSQGTNQGMGAYSSGTHEGASVTANYDHNNNPFGNVPAGYATGIYAPTAPAPSPRYTADLSEPDEGAAEIEYDKIECFFCQTRFHTDILRKHMDDTHKFNGKIPNCPDCGNSYTTPSLIRHYDYLHTVSGQMREWICLYPSCEEEAKTRKEISQHFRENHLKQGTRFRCGIKRPRVCKAAFTSMRELRDHFTTAHPGSRVKRLGYTQE